MKIEIFADLVDGVLPRVLDYSTNAPDLNLATATSRVQAAAMAKKRQPIDDFIDALMLLVWMRRKARRCTKVKRQIPKSTR